MPSKNSLKIYVENGFYHVYNRGVEKRTVFEDDQDYKVFLRYLKEVLSPLDEQIPNTKVVMQGLSLQSVRRPVKSYYGKIDMLAYCLMTNHFHFLIKQYEKSSLEGLMRSLMTRYSMYFNKKYKRVGTLFQGRYKAVSVKDDAYLLHLSRYIHLNPSENSSNLVNTFSSYADYLGMSKTSWVKPTEIMSFFNNMTMVGINKYNSYQKFVESSLNSSSILGELTLEVE